MNKRHTHRLTGCSPAPLANYLKALGIFRLVSVQIDPAARGWWQDEHFCLLTTLDRAELETFFLHSYQPTPLLSPWNKGSGFLQAKDPALDPLEHSTADRFAAFREGVRAARILLDEIAGVDAVMRAVKDRTKTTNAFQSSEQRQLLRKSRVYIEHVAALRAKIANEDTTDKDRAALQQELVDVETIASAPDSPDYRPTKQEVAHIKASAGYKRLLAAADRRFKALKDTKLIPRCRKSWRGLHANWLDAAVVLAEDRSPIWPSLLGTGGNDGRLDFTNNFMKRLTELFDVGSAQGGPHPNTSKQLANALWAQPANALSLTAIGQYQPAAAGGANSSTGTEGPSLVNAWDFVLMMEGTLLFTCQATRRLDPTSGSRASAPFAVRSHAAGHASPGTEKERGEQWMPLWGRPATLGDIKALMGDARVQLGRETAFRPIDVARAISRLGVARGIESFNRFGYLERYGQNKLAVPLGRVRVRQNPRSHLIDDIAGWTNRLQRLAAESHAPARLAHAEKQLAAAVLAALSHDYSPVRWQAILRAAVAIEGIQASGTAIKAGPIPLLCLDWLRATDDGTSEYRLALALGSAAAAYSRDGKAYDPVRHHWLPLRRGARTFDTNDDNHLVHDTRVVMQGRDLDADCAALVVRRLLEAETGSERRLPLVAAPKCAATLLDLAEYLEGSLDTAKIHDLARAFMAVDWRQAAAAERPPHPRDGAVPEAPWLALRLACLPWPLGPDQAVPAEPGMLRRLSAGDGAAAVSIALRRLRACGIRPPLRACIVDPPAARRWAAALAFPIDNRSARGAAAVLDPKQKEPRNA